MSKRVFGCLCILALAGVLFGCEKKNHIPRIGVSFGVGEAARWESEKTYMEEFSAKLGAEIEVRLNKTDKPKTQLEDCKEMIDEGIDVLILTPRDVNDVSQILHYAKQKKVPVVSYARVVLGREIDLFVGYDSGKIGSMLGQYLSEVVYKGDYIILKGDKGDNNAALLYEGAIRGLEPIKDEINIILEEDVPGWSAEQAKTLVLEAIKKNNNKVDAILAPNDKIAGACAEALAELGITEPVAISGMDAELDAIKRIAEGKQSMTVYMDLKQLAETAVQQAYYMAKGEKIEVNAEFDNKSENLINANLITGQLITKENIDKQIVDKGVFTHEQIYGTP